MTATEDLGYRKSPAPFTPAVLLRMFEFLPPAPLRILDPFAGNGLRLHQVAEDHGYESVGLEIEPEFAAAHPKNVVGDARHMADFADDSFDCIVTSVTYANRMADTYDGRDGSDRVTYRIALGHELTAGNSGGMQWGAEYRATHKLAYIACRRVLRPHPIGDEPYVQFVLDVKDHYRKGSASRSARQRVTNWHIETLMDLGFVPVYADSVPAPGMKKGKNGEARIPWESVIAFELDPQVKDGRML